MIFLENHDTSRINEIAPEFYQYKLITTLLATVRGVPQTYYGTEINMRGAKERGDADLRRDFPGGWPSDVRTAFDELGRTDLEKNYFDFTAQLFNWRKNEPVIHFGKTMHYAPQNEVYVYFRFTDEKTIMVVLNANDKDQVLNMQRFNQRIGSAQMGKDVFSNEAISLKGLLTIPANGTKIISFNTP